MLSDVKKVHFIGIGGCSMNGLAQILHNLNYEVTGSDKDSSPFTDRLTQIGIPVSIGHDKKNVEGAELIIYSAAIKKDNVERAAAMALSIPEMERSVALGEISKKYKDVACIAGCHGKTTITSMLAKIVLEGKSDATVHVGGDVDFLSGGTRIGQSDLFITEACEYVESFLTLHPTIALINNIDNDHLDYFSDIDAITSAFYKFLGLLPDNGLFIACTDDARVQSLVDNPPHRLSIITYGFTNANYTPGNIKYGNDGSSSFDIVYNGDNLGRIELNVPGKHNIINALAASIVALNLGETMESIQNGLRDYTLTHRRFEFYGERNGVKLYHDYAHHPAEVRAALDSASRVKEKNLICLLQCNSYTRAKTLFLPEPDCFLLADEVLVVDIFPGREIDDGSVHATDMVAAINKVFPGKAKYTKTFKDARQYIDAHAIKGDLVIALGSGDVYKQARTLL